jgi:hypothetical protein
MVVEAVGRVFLCHQWGPHDVHCRNFSVLTFLVLLLGGMERTPYHIMPGTSDPSHQMEQIFVAMEDWYYNNRTARIAFYMIRDELIGRIDGPTSFCDIVFGNIM